MGRFAFTSLMVLVLLTTSCGKDSPMAPVAEQNEPGLRDREAEPLPPDSSFVTLAAPVPVPADTLYPAPTE